MNNKNKFGEFFTPIVLIEEILDQLPTEVWKNPSLVWLDPCAGKGNFFEIVLERLMKGLQFILPNPIKRKDHIILEMLFMVEINPDNSNELIKTFGLNSNIYISDFLMYETSKIFDIILGNPPYQYLKETKYIGSVGNRILWDKFVVKSIGLLNPKTGYLGFITPSNWRRPEHKLYKLITKDNQLVYLHIYSKKKGLSLFKAQTRFDLYIICNIKSCIKPIIIDENDIKHINIDLTIWPFLPNYAFDTVRKFMIKDNELLKEVLYSSSFYDARKLSHIMNDEYKYQIIHTLTKKGIGLRYSDKVNIHFEISKVILNFNEKQYPINDFDGKYGMSQLSFGISINSFEEGERLINIINSVKFKELLSATKWGAFQTDYRMFKYLNVYTPDGEN